MWAREPDALLMLTPLDGENYTLEMHLRNFPQRQPVAVYWNDGVWEVNANIDAEESIRERDSARFVKRHCKATANDLRRILQSRNETVVDKKQQAENSLDFGRFRTHGIHALEAAERLQRRILQ